MDQHELEAYRRQKTDKETAKSIVEAISRAANTSNREVFKEVVALVQREHRYLQNEIFLELVLPLLKAWTEAATNDRFDARNEYTVKTCQMIIEFLTRENRI